MTKSETDRDIENVEAWAEVVADLLYHVPPDKRVDVLVLATKNEQAEALEREAKGWDNVGSVRWTNHGHLDAITRIKSLLVQVFVRNIANNHSPVLS